MKLTADVLLCICVRYECNNQDFLVVTFQYFVPAQAQTCAGMTVYWCLHINKHKPYLEADFFRLHTDTGAGLVWNALIGDITEARAVQHNQEGLNVPLQIF